MHVNQLSVFSIPKRKKSISVIRKAVIPAAGLGTRFLPATKVVPKELLPIAGKPLIQYSVEEAAASGIDTVILVIGPGKELIKDHFRRDTDLEETLRQRGWANEAEALHQIAELVEIKEVWQERPIGLANAVAAAEPVVGDEPFAVILPDALIVSDVPCIAQLIDCYRDHPGCVVATQTVRSDDVERFGMVEIESTSPLDSRVSRVTSLLERPATAQTRSRTGIFGRYILSPQIFSCISNLSPGRGGEYQLTDALSLCLQTSPVYSCRFDGEHFDAGSKTGFVQATIRHALNDPTIAAQITEYVVSLGSAVETR